jgi:hypothetical protein
MRNVNSPKKNNFNIWQAPPTVVNSFPLANKYICLPPLQLHGFLLLQPHKTHKIKEEEDLIFFLLKTVLQGKGEEQVEK